VVVLATFEVESANAASVQTCALIYQVPSGADASLYALPVLFEERHAQCLFGRFVSSDVSMLHSCSAQAVDCQLVAKRIGCAALQDLRLVVLWNVAMNALEGSSEQQLRVLHVAVEYSITEQGLVDGELLCTGLCFDRSLDTMQHLSAMLLSSCPVAQPEEALARLKVCVPQASHLPHCVADQALV
jgi:hypothetical protein